MPREAPRAIYAGMLVKDDSVSVTFAEVRYRASERLREGEPPLGLHAARDLANKMWPIKPGFARAALRAAVEHIAKVAPNTRRLGCATYGPLGSVDEADRDGVSGKRAALYGRIVDNTVHSALRGLPVYEILHDTWFELIGDTVALQSGELFVRVHTDVMCGAMFESLLRQRSSSGSQGGRKWRTLSPTDGLVFIHLATGVGGAYVVGNRPFVSGLHPEIGYTTPQTLPDDPLAAEHKFPIWFESVSSSTALRARADGKPIAQIEPQHAAWSYVTHYTAQLCAMLTKTLAPHQIVLHGPVVDEAQDGVEFLSRVREAFPFWMGGVMQYEAMQRETFIDAPLAANPMLSGAVVLGALKDIDTKEMLIA